MKKKQLMYSVFILFMSSFIFAGKLSIDVIDNYVKRTLRYPAAWFWTIDLLIYIGFGFLLGFDYLLKEKAKEGRWQIDLSKFFIIGVPALIFAFLYYFIFLAQIPAVGFVGFLVKGKMPYMTLFKILFGYTVATSIYKKQVSRFE